MKKYLFFHAFWFISSLVHQFIGSLVHWLIGGLWVKGELKDTDKYNPAKKSGNGRSSSKVLTSKSEIGHPKSEIEKIPPFITRLAKIHLHIGTFAHLHMEY